ncbi:hypothetical protein [Streptomyces sp. NBC_01803]|uniref:hypothetical protein n=1 Tax=Streptomyces sp. NBC_01803 TaxID=2975946 RepID=UPI002DDB2683|nr:hypothetical protein [Streptomyces sp. NBC_01803]WSA47795.1 hypothetical protein OIE51_05230 [Streptomyces sp. NBC_01803]
MAVRAWRLQPVAPGRFLFLREPVGAISFHCEDITGTSYESGSQATIGVENETGTVAFEYSANTAGVLSDGLAVDFRTTGQRMW